MPTPEQPPNHTEAEDPIAEAERRGDFFEAGKLAARKNETRRALRNFTICIKQQKERAQESLKIAAESTVSDPKLPKLREASEAYETAANATEGYQHTAEYARAHGEEITNVVDLTAEQRDAWQECAKIHERIIKELSEGEQHLLNMQTNLKDVQLKNVFEQEEAQERMIDIYNEHCRKAIDAYEKAATLTSDSEEKDVINKRIRFLGQALSTQPPEQLHS